MAGGALHILVAALEGKDGAFVVEERRLPLGAVVALRALRYSYLGELRSMWILVAILASRGGRVEGDMEHGLLHVRGPMAASAGYGVVSARQDEAGSRVVKRGEVPPLFCVVTCFTAQRRSGRAHLAHADGKLAAMRIGVAGRTA